MSNVSLFGTINRDHYSSPSQTTGCDRVQGGCMEVKHGLIYLEWYTSSSSSTVR